MKRSIGSKFFVLLALLYLYVPIVVLVVMGFNESRYNSLPFSFTLKWYQELAGGFCVTDSCAKFPVTGPGHRVCLHGAGYAFYFGAACPAGAV